MTRRNTQKELRLKSSIVGGALVLALGVSSLMPSQIGAKGLHGDGVRSNSEYINLETGKLEYTLPTISTRYLWKLSQRSVTVNGKALSEPAVMMNGTLYLPLRAFANALSNASVSYNKSTKTATLSMPGLYLTATDGGFVTYADEQWTNVRSRIIINQGHRRRN